MSILPVFMFRRRTEPCDCQVRLYSQAAVSVYALKKSDSFLRIIMEAMCPICVNDLLF